ncbi:MAG: putative Ig domain-containing protein [Terriglobales bacterium]
MRSRALWMVWLPVLCAVCAAQQGGATGEPIVVRTTGLPKGYVAQEYQAALEAKGGIAPLRWELKEGSLPPGVSLHSEGVIIGVPTEAGEFKFTVTVSDSGRPAYQKDQKLVLVVMKPLFLKWGKYPTVNGRRVEGSVVVSNSTEQDFDLTVVIVAVDESGRATALGYQHFSLKKDTTELEIPFGENLARGSYQLNVDAVGELPPATIYRERLAPDLPLVVAAGP